MTNEEKTNAQYNKSPYEQDNSRNITTYKESESYYD